VHVVWIIFYLSFVLVLFPVREELRIVLVGIWLKKMDFWDVRAKKVFSTIFKGLLEVDAANKLGTPLAAGLGFHCYGLVGVIMLM
jgi:hypothetical protein